MEYVQMRDFSEFCEQLHEMRQKFHKWDSCEKTVALYYLMAGLPFANARFLHYALEQCLCAANTPDAQNLERDANDPSFIANVLYEKPQVALSIILSHLPLLRPGNKEASNSYLKTIKKILTEVISPPYKIYNECVEIMSYIFIHPAFDSEEKKSFKHLLKQVMARVTPDNFIHSPVNESSDESVSPNPEHTSFFELHGTRLNKRSNSLTPGHANSNESHQTKYDLWSSQENIPHVLQKPRSFSLSSEKSLLITASNLQSSSSETRLQDLQTLHELPAMKSIVSWLKSLRLHKYSWVFHNLTFKQMLNLNESMLEAIGITKGARHKLLLSLHKLKERSKILVELESEVRSGGDPVEALKKLKGILQTPLQVTNGEDLVSQFMKVLGKIFTNLLMVRQPTDECLGLFSAVCEKAESLDTFTEEQKKRLNMWKLQMTKESHMSIYIQRQQLSINNHRAHYNVPNGNSCNLQPTYAQKSSSYPNMKNTTASNAHRHSVGSVTLKNQLFSVPKITSSIYKCDVPPKGYQSTNSGQFHVRFKDNETSHKYKEPVKEIESNLESLCLQMMEHALGP